MGKSSINWGFSIAMVDYRILYDHPHLASLECQPLCVKNWEHQGDGESSRDLFNVQNDRPGPLQVLATMPTHLAAGTCAEPPFMRPRLHHLILLWLPSKYVYIYTYIESSQTQGNVYFVWGLLINVWIRSAFVQPNNYMDMMYIYIYIFYM